VYSRHATRVNIWVNIIHLHRRLQGTTWFLPIQDRTRVYIHEFQLVIESSTRYIMRRVIKLQRIREFNFNINCLLISVVRKKCLLFLINSVKHNQRDRYVKYTCNYIVASTLAILLCCIKTRLQTFATVYIVMTLIV